MTGNSKKIGVRSLVTWEMRGKMPFLFRFMAKRMEPMIGRDYELGLALLGGYLNEAIPHPQLKFVGEEKLEQFHYWAIPCNGNLRQLEAARRSSIETLRSSPASRIGLSLTLYQQFDPLGVQFQAEIAVPIGDNPPLSNYRQRSFDGGHYFKMTLHGDLRFLPLGWHALASHCRLHKIKTEPTRPALEIYHQDPGATDRQQSTAHHTFPAHQEIVHHGWYCETALRQSVMLLVVPRAQIYLVSSLRGRGLLSLLRGIPRVIRTGHSF